MQFFPTRKIDYAKGMKVCTICDGAVFRGLADSKCPCCNRYLRTRPQYRGERGRQARAAVRKSTSLQEL